MQQLRAPDEVDAVLEGGPAFLYKHSSRCPVSAESYDEVQQFALAHPEIPVYLIDVILDRPLSQYVAERTGTVHQSPQILLVSRGEVVWSTSHYSITARELAAQAAGSPSE